MKKTLCLVAMIALAACGEKKDAGAAADSAAMAPAAGGSMSADTMMKKADSTMGTMSDTSKKMMDSTKMKK